MEKKYRAFEAEVRPHFVAFTVSATSITHTDGHQHTEGNAAAEQEALKDAEIKIKELQSRALKNKDKVIGDLLSAVFDCEPTPPPTILG